MIIYRLKILVKIAYGSVHLHVACIVVARNVCACLKTLFLSRVIMTLNIFGFLNRLVFF